MRTTGDPKGLGDILPGWFTKYGIDWMPVKLRKATECMRCDAALGPGDLGYRPHGNGKDRMRRMCLGCKPWSVDPHPLEPSE